MAADPDLAAEPGTAPTPVTRLRTIGLAGMLRALTSAEMRAAVAGRMPGDSMAYVCDWLLASGAAAALPKCRSAALPWLPGLRVTSRLGFSDEAAAEE
jgi:hypothetical protein